MAAKLKGTFVCWHCGGKFDREYICRRRVHTGSSWGRYVRAYYHVVNLCPDCNRYYIEKERRQYIVFVVILLIALVAYLLHRLGAF